MKKIITIVTILCFLMSNLGFALAPPSPRSKLVGIQAKDIADIQIWFTGILAYMKAYDIDINEGELVKLADSSLVGRTFFNPKGTQFFIHEGTFEGLDDNRFRVNVRRRDDGEADGYGVRDYYVDFSAAGDVVAYPEGGTKERTEEDRIDIARYSDANEGIIDPKIDEIVHRGSDHFAEIKGRAKKVGLLNQNGTEKYKSRIAASRHLDESLLDDIGQTGRLNALLSHFSTSVEKAFEGKNIVFLRTWEADFPVIEEKDEDGNICKVRVNAHLSANAVYFFIPKDLFDEVFDDKYFVNASVGKPWEKLVRYLTGNIKAAPAINLVAMEIGNVYHLPYTVHKVKEAAGVTGYITNQLLEAYMFWHDVDCDLSDLDNEYKDLEKLSGKPVDPNVNLPGRDYAAATEAAKNAWWTTIEEDLGGLREADRVARIKPDGTVTSFNTGKAFAEEKLDDLTLDIIKAAYMKIGYWIDLNGMLNDKNYICEELAKIGNNERNDLDVAKEDREWIIKKFNKLTGQHLSGVSLKAPRSADQLIIAKALLHYKILPQEIQDWIEEKYEQITEKGKETIFDKGDEIGPDLMKKVIADWLTKAYKADVFAALGTVYVSPRTQEYMHVRRGISEVSKEDAGYYFGQLFLDEFEDHPPDIEALALLFFEEAKHIGNKSEQHEDKTHPIEKVADLDRYVSHYSSFQKRINDDFLQPALEKAAPKKPWKDIEPNTLAELIKSPKPGALSELSDDDIVRLAEYFNYNASEKNNIPWTPIDSFVGNLLDDNIVFLQYDVGKLKHFIEILVGYRAMLLKRNEPYLTSYFYAYFSSYVITIDDMRLLSDSVLDSDADTFTTTAVRAVVRKFCDKATMGMADYYRQNPLKPYFDELAPKDANGKSVGFYRFPRQFQPALPRDSGTGRRGRVNPAEILKSVLNEGNKLNSAKMIEKIPAIRQVGGKLAEELNYMNGRKIESIIEEQDQAIDRLRKQQVKIDLRAAQPSAPVPSIFLSKTACHAMLLLLNHKPKEQLTALNGIAAGAANYARSEKTRAYDYAQQMARRMILYYYEIHETSAEKREEGKKAQLEKLESLLIAVDDEKNVNREAQIRSALLESGHKIGEQAGRLMEIQEKAQVVSSYTLEEQLLERQITEMTKLAIEDALARDEVRYMIEHAGSKEITSQNGIPTHEDKRYILLVDSEFFINNYEFSKHRRLYRDRFKLRRISGENEETYINNIYNKAKTKEAKKKTIALVRDDLSNESLEKLTKAGIRFIKVNISDIHNANMAEDEHRTSFQLNTYTIMLLARRIDGSVSSSSSIYQLLRFYLGTHFDLDDITPENYIKALIKGEVADLVKGLLRYRPAEPYDAIEEYEKIAQTLLSA
jgi:hypothetical protein